MKGLAGWVDASPIPHDRRPRVPLSFAQQDAWLQAELAGDVPLGTVVVRVERRGRLDVPALERALTELIRRHTPWRTTLVADDGSPVQVVGEAPVIRLPVLAAGADEEAGAHAPRMVLDDAGRPFDLARGPLVRPCLVRLARGDHRLYLTLHRVIADPVSVHRLLLPELAALYAAFTGAAPSPPPEPPLAYTDFAVWQRRWAASEAAARQLEAWRARLAGAPVLDLPVDRARPAGRRFAGAQHAFALAPALADRLRAVAAAAGTTLYVAAAAGFLGVLHRYTGDEDIVIGTTGPGRSRAEAWRLLGSFANPLALRVDLGGDPTFRALLARVHAVAADALASDGVPFAHVVDAVQPGRDRGRPALFSHAFSLEPFTPPPPGWDVREAVVDPGASAYDLALALHEGPRAIEGRITFRTDLFEPATAARLEAHYRTFLEGAVAEPDRPLSRLRLLDARERRRVVVDFNATAGPYPADATVPELFARQVARRPDAVAVEAGERRVTYAELDRRARAVAGRLRALGVGRGSRVAVALERSPEAIVACLAALKAGAAYVPLSLADPPERLRLVAGDARASALVTHRGSAPARLVPGVPVVDVDEAPAPGQAPDGGEARVDPGDPVYVIYTSGSTGTPNGVCVPHRGLVRLLFGQDWVHLGADEVILQAAALSFDVSALEIWGALLHGGRLVLYPAPVPTVQGLREVIRRHGVTTLWLTPTLFNMVVDEDVEALAPLRQIDIGGEALSVPHVARAAAALPAALLVNGYGPTECSVMACCHRIPRPVDPESASIPIGRPLRNTTAYVLDRHLSPVPIGVPGELCLGGPGVASGYLDRPGLTAERFIPDPFSSEPGARLYRTGDRVRWRADGTLEFLGRLDAQVKLRGLRIELGEIEARLARHAAVREAAVAVRGEAGPGERLVAYVVPRAGGAVGPAALREFLRASLPAYMVPAAFVTLPALPLTGSGKIDRRALPPPGDVTGADDARAATSGPRRDSLESQLLELWQELLGVRPVGVDDDFFELGGHSLLAAQMLEQVGDITGRAVPFAALYQAPTVAGLTRLLAAGPLAAPARAEPAITLNRSGTRTPLVLFHGVLNGGAFYAIRLARRLGPEQPVHVVHPLDGVRRPVPDTIDARADAQLGVVRALQPRGPYRLAGYCNGGLVAYEVARRLRELGERVDLLVLIAAAPFTALARSGRLVRRLAAAAHLSPDRAVEPLARLRALAHGLAMVPRGARLRFLARVLGRAARQRSGVIPVMAREPALQFLVERHYRISTQYFPAPYPGPVALLWPEREPWAPAGDAVAAWRPLASRVDLGIVPGDHVAVVNEHVDVLGDRLRTWLAEPGCGLRPPAPAGPGDVPAPEPPRRVTGAMLLAKVALGAQAMTGHWPLPIVV